MSSYNSGENVSKEPNIRCPECGGTLKVELVNDPDGKPFCEAAECPSCGYCETN